MRALRSRTTTLLHRGGGTVVRRRGGGPFASWSDVDGGGPAEPYLSYLDALDAAEPILAGRARTYELLEPSPGAEILDVGAGTGTAAAALAALVAPGGRIVGVDRSRAMVAEARRRHGSTGMPCEFVAADATALPFADGSFDGYRAERLYEHLADPHVALAEARRVIRPGGRIVIAEPDWEAMLFDASDRRLTRRILAAVADCQTQPWIGRQLHRLLIEAGFVDVATELRTTVGTSLAAGDGHGLGLLGDLAARSVGRRRVDRWIEELEERSRQGTFFSASVFFVAHARAPLAAPLVDQHADRGRVASFA